MLEVRNLSTGYGSIQVLWDINMTVKKGQIVTMIGSNGAGKSTLLRAISRLLPVSHGSIQFEGQEIGKTEAADVVRLGIAQVPEGRRLFSGLSVKQNLLMGAYLRRDKAQITRDLERVYTFFPRLYERQGQISGKMSGGEQQMCAIGRALMSRPKLLLVDELSLGLAPVIVDQLVTILQQIKQDGTTVILVEQDAQTGLELADYGYVLDHGRVVLEGTGAELLSSDKVRAAYLGV